ncbi:MAG: 23S rRNA (pseudouridine(1915)-N(3))-methyltransferase RlmH, partial [Clostridiales bacterium]|nr:23S rRNA (pseudouridine(1915)-N(3))-methyltransferase RlmH [Clostridiales bacterium]
MFKVRVVAVGKIREPYLRDAIGEYAKRLGRYCTLEVVEVADEDISAGESAAQVERHLRAEADRLAARIWGGAREGRYVAALDLRGDAPDSVGFAEKLRAIMGERPEISFVIGGSCGLHTELLSRANCR